MDEFGQERSLPARGQGSDGPVDPERVPDPEQAPARPADPDQTIVRPVDADPTVVRPADPDQTPPRPVNRARLVDPDQTVVRPAPDQTGVRPGRAGTGADPDLTVVRPAQQPPARGFDRPMFPAQPAGAPPAGAAPGGYPTGAPGGYPPGASDPYPPGPPGGYWDEAGFPDLPPAAGSSGAAGYPAAGQEGAGYPGAGHLGAGYPGAAYPGGGHPGGGHPGGGHPGAGFPGGSYPGSGEQEPSAAAQARPGRRRRSTGARVVVGAAVVALIAGAAWAVPHVLGGFPGLPFSKPTPTDPRTLATQVGTKFLTGWQSGDYVQMQQAVLDPKDDMARVYGGMKTRLGITKVVVQPGPLDTLGTSLPYTATVTLNNLGDISWKSTLALVHSPTAGWKVQFTSATVYPGLIRGQRLDLVKGNADRGTIQDRNGKPLTGDADLTANVLGAVSKGQGTSGLQRVLQDKLAGDEPTQLAVVDTSTNPPSTVNVIKEWPGKAGAPVRTTFDLTMQRAAEKALAGTQGTSAMVVIDTETGEVRALANHPSSGLPSSIATLYAPGSTFKIITATAALQQGKTPTSPIPCQQSIVVNGKTFNNAESAPNRTIPMTQAFAESCNTAFISLGQSLPAGALQSAAKLYGFNSGPLLPIASVGGSIPATSTGTEAAAEAIGQGQVGASPLQMASVAAAVASGTWHQPHLLPDCPNCASHPIPVAAQLRPMMRAVVTGGTGTAARGVPGGPVYGKTGTAEFGTGSPPPTHAWFVGYQGNLAFAVFVDRGAFGGTVAAPVAADFLRMMNGG